MGEGIAQISPAVPSADGFGEVQQPLAGLRHLLADRMGLAAGREMNVPLPVSSLVHQIVMDGIGRGFGERDFAAMLSRLAEGSGRALQSEDRPVSDGLG